MPIITIPNEIEIDDLTQGIVGGTGVFDKLMSSASSHIQEELDAGRITNREYSEIYTAALNQSMAIGVQFLLGKQKTYFQDLLLQQQLETERAKTQDTLSDGVTPVTGIIGKDKEVKEAQKELYEEQTRSFEKEIQLKAAKFWTDYNTLAKSLDEGVSAPTNFSLANIDNILDTIKTKNNL